jgi:hypothetical protein
MTTAIKINQNDGKTRNVMTGGETTADFDFPIYADTHLDVYKTATDGTISLLTKDTGYTVPSGSVNVQAGGTINLTTPAVAGEVYTIYQAAPQSRTTDFNQAGDFFADTLNRELDLITQQIQQLRRDLARAPLAPVDTTLATLTLPDPIDGYGFIWDGVAGVIRNTAASLADLETNAAIVSSNISSINTNATNITAINTAATNIAAIIAAPTEAANAASSASDAATALSNTEAARDATFAALDSFDDRYLGAKTSDPTLDNDGDALVAGALYFNSVDGEMKIYTGSLWVAAYVQGNDFLARANNLSDLVSASAARTNLGLGALAVKGTIDSAALIDDSIITFAKLAGSALASQAEAEAGTATNKLMTPERVAQAIAALAGGGGGVSGASVYQATSQSIPNNTYTVLNFDAETWDTDGFHDNATNNSRMTIPAGVSKVRITGGVFFFVGATWSQLALAVYKNGSLYNRTSMNNQIDGAAGMVSAVIDVSEGDYIELGIRQSSGGSKSTNIGNGSLANFMTMEVMA